LKKFGSLVKLIRSTERLGLIRAKLTGAKEATGEVLVFLDSHCEANSGWIEPLLARIKEERTAVVCPIIDSISNSDLAYLGGSHGGMFPLQRLGSFELIIKFRSWNILVVITLQRRAHAKESPTMAGGLFAANREYFFEVGGYDEEMDIWGGENLEISFRVWMCGGSIELIPCSHVGHIYRPGHPYNMTGRNGNQDVHGTNSKRLADVWMDEYSRLFYWYLDNVIPQKFVPDENVYAYGHVRTERSLCLDTLQRLENKGTVILGVFACQEAGSASQMFSISKQHELRRETTCVEVGDQLRPDVYNAVLQECREDVIVKFQHTELAQFCA
uniref:Polypeptide N-acetylgalactosaminyltransferase n=1 Tax=Angiostrongylus cantonensis TaxID=6313 RepID=A0A0K0DL81_ANGCA